MSNSSQSPPTNLASPHPLAPGIAALWQFSRPHTIVGTTLSILALVWIAAFTPGGQFSRSLLLGALVACWGGNLYIVGLNQLTDVAIDRINKPHLPLAAGDFSLNQGRWIVAIAGIMGLAVAAAQGAWLLATVATSLAIGTAYSLPPIRLKRSPFLASLCIFTVRGVIVNLGLFLHFMGQPLAQPIEIPVTIWALTLFVIVFTFAIAIFKDIPDMEGDRQYNISTFTLRLGSKAVFNLARWVLSICYLGMAIGGFLFLPMVNLPLLITSHLGALGIFWYLSFQVDLADVGAIARFYQLIWKLFFLEYLIFPLACSL